MLPGNNPFPKPMLNQTNLATWSPQLTMIYVSRQQFLISLSTVCIWSQVETLHTQKDLGLGLCLYDMKILEHNSYNINDYYIFIVICGLVFRLSLLYAFCLCILPGNITSGVTDMINVTPPSGRYHGSLSLLRIKFVFQPWELLLN